MKKLLLGISVVLVSACFSQAQNKVLVPLLGSKQIVELSDFCKKYKCKAMPRENGLGYVLELPGDDAWTDIMSYPSSKGKIQPQFWSKYRTLMNVDVDRKTGQIASIDFQLRENSRGNKATNRVESLMLADAIYHAVNKRLPLGRSQDELYVPDINDCFLFSRAYPEENIKPFNRVMMTGEVTLQIDKKKMKYRAICSSALNGSTSMYYRPGFWIEIPSFADTIAQSGN